MAKAVITIEDREDGAVFISGKFDGNPEEGVTSAIRLAMACSTALGAFVADNDIPQVQMGSGLTVNRKADGTFDLPEDVKVTPEQREKLYRRYGV